MAYNVLIVEDQEMPRQLFEIYIGQSEHFTHLASIPNAAGALPYCKSHKVDLILMDVMTELGHSGLDAAEEIKKQYNIDVDKRKVVLDCDIKEFGTYHAEVKLFTGVSAKIDVQVSEA